jgi:hypothetical protein
LAGPVVRGRKRAGLSGTTTVAAGFAAIYYVEHSIFEQKRVLGAEIMALFSVRGHSIATDHEKAPRDLDDPLDQPTVDEAKCKPR